MAKYVKIATIGPKNLDFGFGTKLQDIVGGMIDHWQRKLELVLPDKPDLIVMPENCDIPFGLPLSKRKEYYHVRRNQICNLFTKTAKENNCYIVYPMVREINDGTWRNSSLVIDRKGDIVGIYNKNHPMVEETTEGGILCGKEAPIFECDFGRIACVICFDLNFDELRLKYAKSHPDLLIFSSMYHGADLIQGYWAYSCRCHFVGAVAGHPCQVRNPYGEILGSSTNYCDYSVSMVNLDCCMAHLDYNLDKLNALKAKYGRQVEIHDPGYIGSVLITSLAEDKSVIEMIKDFNIELLDDYFARALKHRHTPENIEQ